eukprot:RCo006282
MLSWGHLLWRVGAATVGGLLLVVCLFGSLALAQFASRRQLLTRAAERPIRPNGPPSARRIVNDLVVNFSGRRPSLLELWIPPQCNGSEFYYTGPRYTLV